MKRTMTEKEFRERMLAKWNLPGRVNDVATDAVEVAREAGLEFAPEPLPLPERIANVRDQTSEGNGLWPAESFHASYSQEFWNRLYDEVVARYNAYSDMRTSTEKALRLMRRHMSLVFPFRPQEVSAALDDLETELAKGPK